MNFQYFLKAAAFTMSEVLNTPFLMVSGTRIQDIYVIYDNFSLGTPKYVVEEMGRLQAQSNPCHEAVDYIEKLKLEKRPAYFDFEVTLKKIRKTLLLRVRLREMLIYLTRYYQWRTTFSFQKNYRGLLRKDYFLPAYLYVIRTMIISLWRRFEYFRIRELVRKDLPAGNFVFFPLHLIPENSVITLSKTFDEMECLFQLSKALPVDWKVVVKVNPNMLVNIDTHPNRYYLEMSRLPNVQFINPLILSGEIIEKAAAVACITGTALFEAAVFGKPAFRWGRTEFETINTVFAFDSDRLKSQLTLQKSSNLVYYIQACFNFGVRLNQWDLNYMVGEKRTKQQKADYETQLLLLENMILNHLNARA